MIKSHDNGIPLLVVGCDFKTAAARQREQLVTTPEDRAALFHGIRHSEPEAGLAVLETCNRIEWISSCANPAWIAELLAAQMLQRWQSALPAAGYPSPYMHTGVNAARHLLRVVAGLESLVSGEAQIAGQFQDALRRAREEATSSVVLNGLASHAGHLAKLGQRIGYRSDHRRGIHGLTVDFLKSLLMPGAETKTIVVVGMGSIGRKTAESIQHVLNAKVVRVNRTVKVQHANDWLKLDGLPDCIAQADALVLATGALAPVLQPQHFSKRRRKSPLAVVDLGIPRQAVPAVQQLATVNYYDLDALISALRLNENRQLVEPMEREVEKEVEQYKRFCIERGVVSLLEATQRRRQAYICEQIPAIVRGQLSSLDGDARRQVEAVMKQMISDFSNDSFQAIHEALKRDWENS